MEMLRYTAIIEEAIFLLHFPLIAKYFISALGRDVKFDGKVGRKTSSWTKRRIKMLNSRLSNRLCSFLQRFDSYFSDKIKNGIIQEIVQ